jgi:hypothetical protein
MALYSVAAAVGALHGRVRRPQRMQHVQRHQCSRNAARRQVQHHAPFNAPRARQLHHATHLGEGGEEQVSAHGQVRLDTEEEDQDGRHQRTTANARQAHHQADGEPGHDKSQFMHVRDCSGEIRVSINLLAMT